MAWGAIAGLLGSMMNKESPQLQDVRRKESVLSQPSSLRNNSGSGGGFASLLANMIGGNRTKKKEADWSGSSDDMWLNNRP